MEKVVLFDNIVVYKNAYTKSDELLALYHEPTSAGLTEKANWLEPGVMFREVINQGSKNHSPAINELLEVIQTCKKDFISSNSIDFKEKRHEPLGIREYSEGTSLTWHTDYMPDEDHTHWSMTINVYLNDDYEGGNILFKMHLPPNHAETEVLVDYKPSKGDLLIFPSGYPYYHRTSDVVGGIRYYTNVMVVEKEQPTWQLNFDRDKLKFI